MIGVAWRHRQPGRGLDAADGVGRTELEVAPLRTEQAPAQIIDDFLETYVSWREQCERVRSAYAEWIRADSSARAYAFAVYGAALDQEESAANCHGESSERVRAYSR